MFTVQKLVYPITKEQSTLKLGLEIFHYFFVLGYCLTNKKVKFRVFSGAMKSPYSASQHFRDVAIGVVVEGGLHKKMHLKNNCLFFLYDRFTRPLFSLTKNDLAHRKWVDNFLKKSDKKCHNI
jgi:hypothetical protein